MTETTEAAAKPKDLLARAKDDYATAESAWSDNVTAWRDDTRFAAGDQWPAKIRKWREDRGLPVLTMDKLGQYVRQVVNDGRQNRPGIKVRPADDSGDIKVADGFMGLIRAICARSNVDEASDTALEHAARSGFGFFRVLTQYAHAGTFDQEICIKRIRNPLSVKLDPNIQAADGSDARFGFVGEDIPKEEFKEKHPKAKFTNWEADAGNYESGWLSDKNVRVVEYFYKVEVPGTLHLLADGTVVTDDEYKKTVLEQGIENVPAIERSRPAPVCKVMWAKMTGAEVLEERDWPGLYIPIVPIFGNEIDVDGKVEYSGLIRGAKDAAVMYNFQRSAFAQRVAMTPKAPWLVAEESIDDEETWKDPTREDLAVLRYRAFDEEGRPIPPPRRVDPTDVPAGMAKDMQMSEHDVQASMGMYSASIGERSNEKSGRAIMARQREGDTSTFHYQDNTNRAYRYLGRILVDMIPRVYDSRRVVRTLGEDGESQLAVIDPNHQGPPMKVNGRMVFNLGAGRYDVDVSTGPAYTTRRQESADAMMEMTKANPAVWTTHGDLIAKAQDWPGADEWAKRTMATMPPEVKAAIEKAKAESEGGGPSPEVAGIIAQAKELIGERDAKLEQAAKLIEDLQRENEQLKGNTLIKAAEAETKQYAAETDRLELTAPAMTPQDVALIVRQTMQDVLTQFVAQPPPAVAPPAGPQF